MATAGKQVTVKSLYDGQLANAEADLYVVPANTRAVVKSIMIYNSNGVAEAVTLYFRATSGGTSRVIWLNATLGTLTADYPHLKTGTICMSAGNRIRGFTTTAAKVDIVITGLEET